MRSHLDYTLEEIEDLNRKATDAAAQDPEFLTSLVLPPLEDLQLFFAHLSARRILDAGCGWGYYAHCFTAQDLEYTGIDLSPAMIAAAQKANPELKFEVMSYRKLAYPAERFDGIWACCTLSYEPKRNIQNVLEEFYRVLAPGGILYIIEHLMFEANECVECSTRSHLPMCFSEWEYEEFLEAVRKSSFTIVSSFPRLTDGSMTFILRK